MQRNMRLLPWWWVLRWPILGESLWVIYLIEERGFSLGEVFVLYSLFVAIALVAEVPSGVFADRYGRRPSLILATALIAGGFVVFGLADSAVLLGLAWLTLAVADAFMSGADNALLYETMDALGRRNDFARTLGRFGALQGVVLAVLVFLGAALADATSLVVPFLLTGALALPAVVIAWQLQEPPKVEGSGEQRSFFQTGAMALRRARGTRTIATVILVFAVITMSPELMGLTLQPIVRAEDLPLWTLGAFGAGVMLASAAGGWSSGWMRDRLGVVKLLWLSALLATASLFAGAAGTVFLLPLFLLPTFWWSLVQPQVTEYLSHRTEPSERATVLSLMNFVPGLFGIGMAIGLAPLIDAIGLRETLAGAAIVLLALGLLTLTVWTRSDRHEVLVPPVAIE
jgi:MFS family permease